MKAAHQNAEWRIRTLVEDVNLYPSLRHSSSICLLVEDWSRRRSVSQMLLTRSLDTTLLSGLARDQWTARPQQWLTSFLGIGRGRPVLSIAGEHASKSLAEVASHRGEKNSARP